MWRIGGGGVSNPFLPNYYIKCTKLARINKQKSLLCFPIFECFFFVV